MNDLLNQVHCSDNIEFLRNLPDDSIDSIVTDPPYGLSFMGKKWDYDVPSVDVWTECLRVLKPGGHLLAFAGTRTQHRMAVNIEDAGFEIRDMIAWVYGSGFPKSMDVSKAIDKAAGAEREILSERTSKCSFDPHAEGGGGFQRGTIQITIPATDEARKWNGWGTALKPALEPITVARKPFKGTVAENVLKHGTGAISVDGCRVGGSTGRFPANLIHDGSDEVVGLFPVTVSGALNAGHKQGAGIFGKVGGDYITRNYGNDSGSAARFFYCAKASKRDRDEGLGNIPIKAVHRYGAGLGEGKAPDAPAFNRNNHPTVKPTDLMRYLCRLITPPDGIVLDPFAGSGSTGKAALLEGFRFIGVEREAEYCKIANARIKHAQGQQIMKFEEGL